MARVIGAIGIAVLVALIVNFRWLWPSTATASAAVRESIRTVRIDNGSGDVRVHVGGTGAPAVRQHFSWHRFFASRPESAYRIEGDRLVLGGCGWNCSVDYEVSVPRGSTVVGEAGSGDVTVDGAAAVDLRGDSGTVRVQNVSGPVRATVGSGNLTVSGAASVDARDDSGSVRVQNVSGQVKAVVGSGDIELSGIGQAVTVENDSGDVRGDRLRGPVNADASSGSVRLALDVAQDVRAEVDSGDIDLTVPNDRYRVQGSTDSGGREIRVPTDPAAAHVLDLSTDSGSVTVRPASR